jgi:uncharacterized protein
MKIFELTRRLKFSHYNFFIPVVENDVCLLYNSLHNSLLKLNIKFGEQLQNMNDDEINLLDSKDIMNLKDNGIIINADLEELDIIRERIRNKRDSFRKIEHIEIILAPTNLCNMRCIYCYEGEQTVSNEFDKSQLKDVLSKIILSEKIKSLHLVWFGGEPLLCPDLIDEISTFTRNLCDKNGRTLTLRILTNGTLLSENKWNMLDKNKIHTIQITLDGPAHLHNTKRPLPGKNSFELIMQNLKHIPSDDFVIMIRINGDKEVFKEIEELFKVLYTNELWPHKGKIIQLQWAFKSYDTNGHCEPKDIYFTGYEFHQTLKTFINLKLYYLNKYRVEKGLPKREIIIRYPKLAKFLCRAVESECSTVIDGNGDCYKCYNSIGRFDEKVNTISDFDENSNMDHNLCNIDRISVMECKYCKILPICEEECNYKMVKRNRNMVCSPWRFFMKERMKTYYLQKFNKTDENCDNR